MSTRGAQIECNCANCKRAFMARVADRKRGWARFCSKRCKAREQEARTGQFAELTERMDSEWDDQSWDAHKNDW